VSLKKIQKIFEKEKNVKENFVIFYPFLPLSMKILILSNVKIGENDRM